PHTATNLNNLGYLLQELGDLEEARSCHERALAIWEKVLGSEHVSTAKSLHNLGLLFFEKRNFPRARALWERALRILDSRLGPNHPDTKSARSSLSNLPGARRKKRR